MRKTAREEYLDQLQRAMDDLQAIDSRFRQGGDLVSTRGDLNRWKEATARVIERYGGAGTPKAFRSHVDFDVLGLSGGYVCDGIEKYKILLGEVIREARTTDVKQGYSEDVRIPLEQIDELSERLTQISERSMSSGQMDWQSASEGLTWWKDDAYKVLTKLVGERRAGEISTMHPDSNSNSTLNGSFDMYTRYLVDLKADIQRYPHHLISISGTAGSPASPFLGNPTSYVDGTRLQELRAIGAARFDLCRLVRLCEELNIAWREGAYHAVAMLVRAVMDHVPPVFGVESFDQIVQNYAGARSFKEAVGNLVAAARKIGDAHLHTQVRKREVLPNGTQVNYASQLDVLLAEIVRVLK